MSELSEPPASPDGRQHRLLTEPATKDANDKGTDTNATNATNTTNATNATGGSQDLTGIAETLAAEPTPTLSSMVYARHWENVAGDGGSTKTTTATATTEPERQSFPSGRPHSESSFRKTHRRSLSVRKLINTVEEVSEETLTSAANTLQKVYRGWSQRKQYQEKRLEAYILAKNPLTTLFCFLIFLFIIIMTCVFETENVQYYMAHQLQDWIVEEEFTPEQSSIRKNFNDIESEEEFWQYLQGPFVNNLFTEQGPPHVLFPGTVLAGAVRLRQMRVQPQCDKMQHYVPKIFQKESGPSTGCWPSWSEGEESYASYGIHDTSTAELRQRKEQVSQVLKHESQDETDSNTNERMNRLRQCFKYTDGATSAPITKATTVSITGWEENYPSAGGFVCDMSGNYTHAQVLDLFQDLKTFQWLDDGTRVVLLEMSMYSTNENIFAYGMLMVEFWPTGTFEYSSGSRILHRYYACPPY